MPSFNKIFRQPVVLEGCCCRDAKTCNGALSSWWAEVLSQCPPGERYGGPGRATGTPLGLTEGKLRSGLSNPPGALGALEQGQGYPLDSY